MTARKCDIELASRLTAYVTREEGAAELRVSPSTWDEMVEAGLLPQPVRLGLTGKIVRWRWADVDKAISQGAEESLQCESPSEPFFRGLAHGQTQGRKRVAS